MSRRFHFDSSLEPLPDVWIGWQGVPAHPDSPAGGAGPGYFRSPLPIGMDYDPFSSVPHPHSPAGQRMIAAWAATPITPHDRLIAWGRLLKDRPQFKRRVIEISEGLGTDPDWLMAIMVFETGQYLYAKAGRKGVKGAVGLIQFTGDGAKAVGKTKQELYEMSDLEQLDYVEKYFKRCPKPLKSLEDFYAWVHWPAGVGKANDAALYTEVKNPGPKDPYSHNAGLDLDHDGKVTKGEAASRVREVLREGRLPINLG